MFGSIEDQTSGFCPNPVLAEGRGTGQLVPQTKGIDYKKDVTGK